MVPAVILSLDRIYADLWQGSHSRPIRGLAELLSPGTRGQDARCLDVRRRIEALGY